MNEWHVLNLAGSGQPPDSADQWQLSGQISWPEGRNAGAPSGRLKLAAPMGAALHGALTGGGVSTVTDESGTSQAWRPDLEFTVDEAMGWLAGARGTVHIKGTLTPEDFRLTTNLRLAAPDDAWMPPNSGLLSDPDQSSGASHTGPDTSQRGRHRRGVAHRSEPQKPSRSGLR